MRYITHTGQPDRCVFKLAIDKDTGAEELFVIGKEDFQEFIEASKDSTDLQQIITRVRNGELELLNQKQGVYGDFSNMPMTLQELLQTRIDAKQMYENLPKDVREKMDYDTFTKDAGSVDWLKGLGFKFDEKEEEVKDNADA